MSAKWQNSNNRVCFVSEHLHYCRRPRRRIAKCDHVTRSRRQTARPSIRSVCRIGNLDTGRKTIFCGHPVLSGAICLQGSATRLGPGLVNFVPAVARRFCLNLPPAFTQPVQQYPFNQCGRLHELRITKAPSFDASARGTSGSSLNLLQN